MIIHINCVEKKNTWSTIIQTYFIRYTLFNNVHQSNWKHVVAHKKNIKVTVHEELILHRDHKLKTQSIPLQSKFLKVTLEIQNYSITQIHNSAK